MKVILLNLFSFVFSKSVFIIKMYHKYCEFTADFPCVFHALFHSFTADLCILHENRLTADLRMHLIVDSLQIFGVHVLP